MEAQLRKCRPACATDAREKPGWARFRIWSLALLTMGMDIGEGYERVIWANDSIYFPVRPTAPFIYDMEHKNFNLYGLSESTVLGAYHIQSFFLAFDREAQKKISAISVEIRTILRPHQMGANSRV